VSGPGAAALGASPAWTLEESRESAQLLPRPLVPSSFPLSGRAFLPPRFDSFPSVHCQRPTSSLSLSFSLLFSHQQRRPPFPYPLSPSLPPTVSILFPLCVCVLVDCQFWDCSCQGYRVRVDHLVIDKRMRSGEAGRNSTYHYASDSSVPHDNDRYSIPLLSYLLRDNIILFHFFFTISFFSPRLETPCAGSNGTSIAERD
jgi:hypothetical protein